MLNLKECNISKEQHSANFKPLQRACFISARDKPWWLNFSCERLFPPLLSYQENFQLQNENILALTCFCGKGKVLAKHLKIASTLTSFKVQWKKKASGMSDFFT